MRRARLNDDVIFVQENTQELHAAADRWWPRVRYLLEQRGIRPRECVLAEWFLDDVELYYGILVTPDQRVYEFDYDYLRRPETEGEIVDWKDITQIWRTEHQLGGIAIALELMARRTDG